jgi:hypothetical protein
MGQIQKGIRYLSDEDSDYALLESAIEKGHLGDMIDYNRVKVEQASPPSVDDFIRSVGGNTDYADAQKCFDDDARARAALPTRFDSPGQYSILTDLIANVLDAAAHRGIQISYLPKIATLPTGQINACALRVDGASSPFLLFDSELLSFCNLFAKAWALCIPKKDIEGGRFQFELYHQSIPRYLSSSGKEGIRRFHEVLSAITEKGSPTLAPPYPPPPSIVYPAERIRTVMEHLVVGHELAHYVHGDIGVDLYRAIKKSVGAYQGTIPDAHSQEHLADVVGALLALDCEYYNETHFSLAYLGLECWFASMLLLERFGAAHIGSDINGWDSPSSLSHPSWFNRRQVIRSAVFDWYQEKELVSIISENISFMEVVIDHIWGCLKEAPHSSKLIK